MIKRVKEASEIVGATVRACRIAIDAAHNLAELIERSSSAAFVEVRQCELELDRIEAQIDRDIARAVTRVGESTARELLLCMKMSTDVERIGDLLWWSAQRIQQDLGPRGLADRDRNDLGAMTSLIAQMLEQTAESFDSNDAELAEKVLKRDVEIDHLRSALFERHLQSGRKAAMMEVVLVAQALERAGDHVKNLAEGVLHRAAGESFLHKSAARLRVDI